MIKKLLVLFAGLALIAGCSSSENGFSSQDIMFAEMMIPHHEQAIAISDLALRNSSNPAVLALAEQISNAQAPEINQMKSWPGVDASTHMGNMMDGMLSEDEMSSLAAAKDEAFDRLFLEGMIKHHEGAIEMAEMVIDSNNVEVSSLARAIIAAQAAEIAEMQALLK